MAKSSVAEISPGDQVAGQFLVKGKTLGETRYGKPYLTVRLADKSGEIRGRVWENAREIAASFEKGDVVAIRAMAEVYQEEIQLNISVINKCLPEEVNLADFLPAAERPSEEMLAELKEVLGTITNPYLKGLVAAFFEDEEFLSGFSRCPAAKARHHVYLGGLLEHTLSVVKLAVKVSEHYTEADRDLLVASAFLHDLGKIKELSYTGPFDYTDEGRLLGHILMGVELADAKMKVIPDFPLSVALEIKHMILSHHGQYEFQSPKKPKTLEALILHHIEDMDGKVNDARQRLAKAREEGKAWTDYDRNMGRFWYAGPPPPPEEEDEG